MRVLLILCSLLASDLARASEPTPSEPSLAGEAALALEHIRDRQQGRTSRRDERAILGELQALSDGDIHVLKVALDGQMAPANLHRLVYSDIDDRAIREAVLAELGRAGRAAGGQVRVLSDIDDTVYARLRDERFEKGTRYPGVQAFQRELALATGVDEARAGQITFVSARPGDRAGAVESATLTMLQRLGFSGATLLTGDWAHVLDHGAMAEAKYANFLEYRALYPEYRFVFVGDSGQGDAAFGGRIRADFPEAVPAVFIHDIVGDGKERTAEPERTEAAARGLYFFDTYAGAAVRAFELGLLDRPAVERVIAADRRELDEISFPDASVRAARQAELDAEVAAFEAGDSAGEGSSLEAPDP